MGAVLTSAPRTWGPKVQYSTPRATAVSFRTWPTDSRYCNSYSALSEHLIHFHPHLHRRLNFPTDDSSVALFHNVRQKAAVIDVAILISCWLPDISMSSPGSEYS